MNRSLSLALSLSAIALTACQSQAQTRQEIPAAQSIAEIETCLRTVMELDEGTWNYMGTNAQFRGTFATYQTTSVHASAGPDTWSNMSYGGDMSPEESNVVSYVRLVGNTLVPLEDGELQEDGRVVYTSCSGPDSAGRYFATLTYDFDIGDGITIYATSESWYSENGSHFQEDLRNEKGRLVGRRSGINYPVTDAGEE